MMMSDLKRGKFSSEFLLPGEFHNNAAFLISCGKFFFCHWENTTGDMFSDNSEACLDNKG